MSEINSRGVVFIHSATGAVCPHIEWAVGRAIGSPVNFDWRPQPLLADCFRTEFEWLGPRGAGSLIASSLIGWGNVRFEVTEHAEPGGSGERWIFTPALGAFHTHADAAGNYLVTENRLRALLDESISDSFAFRDTIDIALGGPWDRELDVFRSANDAATVTWLHRVG